MPNTEWGILIVNYLFLGGLSAGLYFVSGFATYLQELKEEESYGRIARYGAMIAPWPVALGSFLLIFDLGNWYRFYKLFLHFRWQSPMSIGSWLLLLFNGVALVYFWAWLPEEYRKKAVTLFRLPRMLDRDLSGSRRLLAVIGFPLSVGVAIYTGVLLGAVQARPRRRGARDDPLLARVALDRRGRGPRARDRAAARRAGAARGPHLTSPRARSRRPLQA